MQAGEEAHQRPWPLRKLKPVEQFTALTGRFTGSGR